MRSATTTLAIKLLTTLGRLAGQPPEIAYTLGQANWYGLLWIWLLWHRL